MKTVNGHPKLFTLSNRFIPFIRGDGIGINLLSVDWDYFVFTDRTCQGSYLENKRSLIDDWYKRYIIFKQNGTDIKKSYRLSPGFRSFWEKIKEFFRITNRAKVYVSDSHRLSYKIAAESKADTVYLFDAHSDLGYGGMTALNFEVNCANWLGKLFRDGIISRAVIVYSPYTSENPEYFKAMNRRYNIEYADFNTLKRGVEISAVHVCRSGAWVPPWFDDNFMEFVNLLNIPYEKIDLVERKWDPENMSLAERINYMLA